MPAKTSKVCGSTCGLRSGESRPAHRCSRSWDSSQGMYKSWQSRACESLKRSIFMSHKVSETRVVIKKMPFYEVKPSKINIFGEHYVVLSSLKTPWYDENVEKPSRNWNWTIMMKCRSYTTARPLINAVTMFNNSFLFVYQRVDKIGIIALMYMSQQLLLLQNFDSRVGNIGSLEKILPRCISEDETGLKNWTLDTLALHPRVVFHERSWILLVDTLDTDF